jgi:hypothetical protein
MIVVNSKQKYPFLALELFLSLLISQYIVNE